MHPDENKYHTLDRTMWMSGEICWVCVEPCKLLIKVAESQDQNVTYLE